MTTMDIGRAASAGPEVRSYGLLARVFGGFRRIAARRKERATLIALAQMDAYMLRDIGIEPQDIYDALDGRKSSLLFNPIRKS
jgi:uncharacterized protein YjiS (DUF1127 family)